MILAGYYTGGRNFAPTLQSFHLNSNSVYEDVRAAFEEFPVQAAAVAPRGELVATASTTRGIELWKWNGTNFEGMKNSRDPIGAFEIPDGSMPMYLSFGPGDGQLTVGTADRLNRVLEKVYILDFHGNVLQSFVAPSSIDSFMQFAFTRNSGTRLVATSLFRRVLINDSRFLDLTKPLAEPLCFQGIYGFPVFSGDGKELLTLSGDNWGKMNTVQLWDVSFRVTADPHPDFRNENVSAPDWLSPLLRAVSGGLELFEENEQFMTVQQVFSLHKRQTEHGPYSLIWRHFLPESCVTGASFSHGK